MFTDQLELNKRCIIIGAAPVFTGHEVISDRDFVIVCDGGLAHVQSAGIHFDVLLGDFDSWEGPIPQGDFETITLPKEKDDTDLMYAVKFAIQRGYVNFIFLGVLGGRTDHFLGNLAAGAYVAEKGGLCVLFGQNERLYVLKDNILTLSPIPGTIVSVLSWGDQLRHVTLSGLAYPLEDATLTNDFPLGVSNVIPRDAQSPTIQIGEGTAIVIVSQ
ncbi:MAG: thiamine diphosphokinase [Clostridia bacterium]|nr:thiamine diphosphokinase [Clostridia bacterium]